MTQKQRIFNNMADLRSLPITASNSVKWEELLRDLVELHRQEPVKVLSDEERYNETLERRTQWN